MTSAMSEPDLVAILDRWIAECIEMSGPAKVLAWHAKCARDEIVALRKERQDRDNEIVAGLVKEMVISVARGQALEEAARACDDRRSICDTACTPGPCACGDCAAAIRALKGKSE